MGRLRGVPILQWCDSLGETEVTETHVLVVVKKDIFGLDVAVDDVTLVQVVDGLEDLAVDPEFEVV